MRVACLYQWLWTWRKVTCPHAHRPPTTTITQGATTCPDCGQQWRRRWWLAQCSVCSRRVPLTVKKSWGVMGLFSNDWIATPVYDQCTHCQHTAFELTAHHTLSPFALPYAVATMEPITPATKPNHLDIWIDQVFAPYPLLPAKEGVA